VTQLEQTTRIDSLDQLRGYTIVGMITVNFLGEFDWTPWMLKHHREGYSYADTIAPLFLFIVGIGFRLSFLRRLQQQGLASARWAAAKRYLILIVIGIVVYGPFDWHDWWDALVDIGLAGFLALPFIERSASIRVGAAVFYLLLFQALFSFTSYGPYLMEHSYDGGPLGPLSWVFNLLLGTLAYDWLVDGKQRETLIKALIWGTVFSLLGWFFRMDWPGVKMMWPFSQYYMTIPYTLYSTGLAFFAFGFFLYIRDMRGFSIPHLKEFGMNPLALYIFHILLIESHADMLHADSSPLWLLTVFAGFYLCCYAVAWRLYKDRAFIKI
jgi:predicted acyltransferase